MIKLPIKFYSEKVKVIINPVTCDYCQRKVSEYEAVSSVFTSVVLCDACYEIATEV